LLRAIAAAKVPLTGDEAYYWEWAKHLALGYADHPPMVAYLISAVRVGHRESDLDPASLSAVRRRRDARGRGDRETHQPATSAPGWSPRSR
jgi:hypothetical protein